MLQVNNSEPRISFYPAHSTKFVVQSGLFSATIMVLSLVTAVRDTQWSPSSVVRVFICYNSYCELLNLYI
jgi:hypothetical protein